MTISEVRQVILCTIEELYNLKYIGQLHITKLYPKGYYIKFGMDTPDQPNVIYAEMDDDSFLKFIRQELKDKRFNLRDYGLVLLLEPFDCGPRNTSCSCNDQG